MNPNSIQEAKLRLKKMLDVSFNAIGLKKLPEIKIDDLEDGIDGGISIDGGIFIVPFEIDKEEYKRMTASALKAGGCPAKELNKSINASWRKRRPAELIRYEIGVLVHDPGVRYYSDGSGQPPSDDYVPVEGFEDCTSIQVVVDKAIEIYIKNIVDIALQNMYYSEAAKEDIKEIM